MVWLDAGNFFGDPGPVGEMQNDTLVEGMGRIYARAADVPASVDRVTRDALARVAARHGLPPPSGAPGLSETLRKAGRTAAADAVDAIESRRGAALGRGHPTAGDLVTFTREVDRLLSPIGRNG